MPVPIEGVCVDADLKYTNNIKEWRGAQRHDEGRSAKRRG